jgi:hypothetical protein
VEEYLLKLLKIFKMRISPSQIINTSNKP